MTDERNRYQITRIDARSCFVESLSDAFDFGKVHLTFCSYDKHKPAGQRMTDSIQIYIDIADWLELCRMLDSGELRCLLQQKSKAGDRAPVREWLGGTSARKLAGYGSPRPDGKASPVRHSSLRAVERTPCSLLPTAAPARRTPPA